MILLKNNVQVGIGSLLFLLTFVCLGVPTVLQVPSKVIGYECNVSPTPELGKEFTVTFTLWLDEETRYDTTPGAGAEFRISISGPQQYVSGDTLLSGKYLENERCTLRATYRAVTPGFLSIAAGVCTRDEVDSSGELLLGGYTSTSVRCAQYQLVHEQADSSPPAVDSLTGVVIRRVTMEDVQLPFRHPPPMPVGSPDEVRKKHPRRELDESLRKRPTEAGRRDETSLVLVSLAKGADGRYTALDTAKVKGNKPCRVLLIDKETKKAISGVHLAIDAALGTVRPLDDTTFLFVPTGEVGPAVLDGIIGPYYLSIDCQISAVWILDGAFYFTDPSGNNDNRMEYLDLHVYTKSLQVVSVLAPTSRR